MRTAMLPLLAAVVPADVTRDIVAGLSIAALFLLGVAVVRHPPGNGWRLTVWALAAHQGVVAYAAYSRARSTPPGLPTDRADVVLLLLMLSTLAVTVSTLGVFAAHNRRRTLPGG